MTAAPDPSRSSAAASTSATRRAHVLLVEDEPTIVTMYELKLSLEGHQVSVATNGPDGLERARHTLPDVVLLDLRLPGMDGFDVLSELRSDESTSRIPVIILTNWGEEEQKRRAKRLGAVEFLVKSHSNPAFVAARVDHWLKRASAPA